MQSKYLLVGILLFLSGSMMHLFAQESFTSSGGGAVGTNGAVTYSVGQTFYTVVSGSGNEVAAGVQQPYEISEVKSNDSYPDLNLHLAIYPNPAKDYLMLSIENYLGTYLTCQLMDMSGKQLKNQTLTSDETRIPLSDLTPATYLLNIVRNKSIIKSFKILKR